MPNDVRRALELDDDENGRLHLVWSRSGKRLIVTATTHRRNNPMQVEVRPDQVTQIVAFLSETI